MTTPVPLTAVVPLKALERAKGRLADGLSAGTRSELAAWMCGRVLDACLAAADRVILVAGDDAAGSVAVGRNVEVIVERRPGLATAISAAEARCDDDVAVLIVAADLPLINAADVLAVQRAGTPAPSVVVAPTTDGGTGALLRNPVGLIPTAFGPGSATVHQRLAQAAGVPVRMILRAGLHLDVDTPAALQLAADLDEHVAPWAQRLGRD